MHFFSEKRLSHSDRNISVQEAFVSGAENVHADSAQSGNACWGGSIHCTSFDAVFGYMPRYVPRYMPRWTVRRTTHLHWHLYINSVWPGNYMPMAFGALSKVLLVPSLNITRINTLHSSLFSRDMDTYVATHGVRHCFIFPSSHQLSTIFNGQVSCFVVDATTLLTTRNSIWQTGASMWVSSPTFTPSLMKPSWRFSFRWCTVVDMLTTQILNNVTQSNSEQKQSVPSQCTLLSDCATPYCTHTSLSITHTHAHTHVFNCRSTCCCTSWVTSSDLSTSKSVPTATITSPSTGTTSAGPSRSSTKSEFSVWINFEMYALCCPCVLRQQKGWKGK